MPLEDASEGWLEPLGHLLWEVLEGKGLIVFASMSQNPMKEMTQNNKTLVTEFHKTEEMTGPWRQSRRTKLSEQIEEIQRRKHKFSQGSFPFFPVLRPHARGHSWVFCRRRALGTHEGAGTSCRLCKDGHLVQPSQSCACLCGWRSSINCTGARHRCMPHEEVGVPRNEDLLLA